MSQLEKKLWADVKKATSNRVHWTRLEAWVGVGVPDLNGVASSPISEASDGIEFWVELKICRAKSLVLHDLWRPAQIAWQTTRARHKRNVFNLVLHSEAQILYIFSASKIAQITEVKGPCTVAPDASFEGPMKYAKSIQYIIDTLANDQRQ